jgi:sugar lactone lactonase YvrE
VAGSSGALLGIGFQPGTNALLIIDFGAGKVLSVNSHTGASTVFMTPFSQSRSQCVDF